MNVIVAGSRNFSDYNLLVAKLDYYLSKTTDPVTIISGGANGADKLGERYAKEHRLGLKIYPADWNKYGKRAGYIRNEIMADVADCCVCFWDNKSHGTKHMIDICHEKNIKLRVVLF